MYLTTSRVFHYLQERGLVSSRSVIDGDVLVSEVSRHNRGFSVIRRNQPSLFAKQIQFLDERNISCLRREAECYRFAKLDFMPRFVDYDEARHVLIVERLDESEDFYQAHQRLGHFPIELGAALGETVRKLHGGQGKQLGAALDTSIFPREIPWILTFHQNAVEHESPANIQLHELLKSDEQMQRMIDEQSQRWERESLIHGDLKWNNVLISQQGEGGIRCHVVDWELADCGDPCWDVATVFQSYWSWWILSSPVDAETSLPSLINHTQSMIDSMRPSISAFWRHYVSGTQYGCDHLEKCVRFTAVRLLQTIYEHSFESTELSLSSLTMYHFSREVLSNPDQAIAMFFE